jgi:phage terminase large subunit-like protein
MARSSSYADPRSGGRTGERLSEAEKWRRGTLRLAQRLEEQASRIGAAVDPAPSEQDYLGVATGYAADVASGAIVACQWVKLACLRQTRDLARSATDVSWPYVWDPGWAVKACAFLERLPHVEGKWATPTIRLEPSQVFLLTTLFGWRHREDVSIRRFTVLYYELGRKGAKSTLMAGISLFHMAEEEEPGASVVLGATTGSQARIVFGIMQRMIQKSPWLRSRGFEAFANAIITADGTAKPINAKASTQDGLNPSLICLDESHAQDFELHDVLKSSQGARRNPLLTAPTTAGYDLLSVGYALRTQLTKVLQGVFDADHFLGLIYTLDEDDDWRDPAVWVKANPMLKTTPTIEWVTTYCADAKQNPGLEGEFKVKVCSQWMQSASAWLSMTKWDLCADPTLKLEDFIGQRCWIGADLAQNDDIAAVALLFERGPEVCAFVRFYLPRAVVDERGRTVPEYHRWVKAGLLHLSDGDMTDEDQIEKDIRGWCGQFQVMALRFDQFGSGRIVSRLVADSFPAAILDKNAKNMTPPARDLETRVRHRRFRHDGNSCLKWMASNAVVTRGVNDSILPKKESPESPNKIDGIDAILQADSARLVPEEKPKGFQMFVLSR